MEIVSWAILTAVIYIGVFKFVKRAIKEKEEKRKVDYTP